MPTFHPPMPIKV